jgi:hypothetical protein
MEREYILLSPRNKVGSKTGETSVYVITSLA